MSLDIRLSNYALIASLERLADAGARLANAWNTYTIEKTKREASLLKSVNQTLGTLNGFLIVSSCALLVHSVSTLWFLNLKRQEHNQRNK
jgi:hypothetical protein